MAVEMILGEMIEKSLKQREQLEGYRRDKKHLKHKHKIVDDFGKIFNNDKSSKVEKTK